MYGGRRPISSHCIRGFGGLGRRPPSLRQEDAGHGGQRPQQMQHRTLFERLNTIEYHWYLNVLVTSCMGRERNEKKRNTKVEHNGKIYINRLVGKTLIILVLTLTLILTLEYRVCVSPCFFFSGAMPPRVGHGRGAKKKEETARGWRREEGRRREGGQQRGRCGVVAWDRGGRRQQK